MVHRELRMWAKAVSPKKREDTQATLSERSHLNKQIARVVRPYLRRSNTRPIKRQSSETENLYLAVWEEPSDEAHHQDGRTVVVSMPEISQN